MAVLFGVCNWVHPLLQSPSCCKELKEAGIDAIQLDLGSAEEDFPLSSPGIPVSYTHLTLPTSGMV